MTLSPHRGGLAYEQLLAPISPGWIQVDGDPMIDFAGSCPLFSYHLHVYVHALNDTMAVGTAIFTIQDMHFLDADANALDTAFCQAPGGVYRCRLRLDVSRNSRPTPAGTTKETTGDDWIASCVFVSPHKSLSFAIPFAKKLLRDDELLIHAALVKIEPFHQALVPASSVPLPSDLITLNDADFCDLAIVPKDSSEPMHVSRAILARSSPFFVTMFRGPWAEASKTSEPVSFGWTAAALVSCLIHIYSGWIIGQPLPESEQVSELCAKFQVDLQALSAHQLMEVMDLARLLELTVFLKAATNEMIRVLHGQLADMQ